MKKGDILEIFEDPITKIKSEGNAKLVKRLENFDQDMERWQVKFISDGAKAERWIRI